MAGVFVWRRSGSPWPGYLSFALIAYSPALLYFINRFYSEAGAALVVLFLSLALHRAVRRPSLWAFVLAGLLLAMGAPNQGGADVFLAAGDNLPGPAGLARADCSGAG